MISPMQISTRGRIRKSVSKTLTLATIGWLLFSGSPTPPPFVLPKGGGYAQGIGHIDYRILLDDDEIFYILQMWIKANEECQC